MTLQETIEDAVRKFVLQGHRCVRIADDNAILCMYENGTERCIVGHALPDNLLKLVSRFEGPINLVMESFPKVRSWAESFPEIKDPSQFWLDFQSLHDKEYFRLEDHFKIKVRYFLEKYGLSTDFVNTLDFSNWDFTV